MTSSFSLSDCLHFSSQNDDFQFFSIRLSPFLLSKRWLPVFLYPTVSISPLKTMISSFSLSDCLHRSSQNDDFQFFSIRLSPFLLSKLWFPVFLYTTASISPLKPMTSSFSLSDCLHFSSQNDDFQFFSIRLSPFLLSKRWLPVFLYPTVSISPLKTMTSSFSLSDCLHFSSQNDDFQFFLYPTVSISPLKTMTSSFSLSDCLHFSSQNDDFQFFSIRLPPSLLSKRWLPVFSLFDCLHRSSQNDDFQFFSIRLSPFLLSKRWLPVFLYPTVSISPLKPMTSSFSLSDCLHFSSQNDDFQFFSIRLSPFLLSNRWLPVFLYPTVFISPLKTMTSSFSLSDCLHFSSQNNDFQFFSIRLSPSLLSKRWLPVFLYPTVSISPLKTMTSSFSLSDCLHFSSQNDAFQFFSIRLPPFLLSKRWLPVFLYPTASIAPLKTMTSSFFSIRLPPSLLSKRWFPVFLYPTVSISPLKPKTSIFSSIRLSPFLLSNRWLPVFLYPTVSISPLKPMTSSFSLSDCLHFSCQTDDFQFFSIRLSSFLLSNRWLPVFLYPTVFISPLKPMTSSFSLSDCLHFSSQNDDFQFFSIRLSPFLLSNRWFPVFLYPTVSISPLKTMTSSFSLSDCLHRSSQNDDFQFFSIRLPPFLLSKRWFPVFLYPTASIAPLKTMISSFSLSDCLHRSSQTDDFQFFLYPTVSIAPLKTMTSSFLYPTASISPLKTMTSSFSLSDCLHRSSQNDDFQFFSIRLSPFLLSKRWLPVFLYPTVSIAPLKTMISSFSLSDCLHFSSQNDDFQFFSIRLSPSLLSKRWFPVFLYPTVSISPLKTMTSSFSLSDCLHRFSQNDDFQFFSIRLPPFLLSKRWFPVFLYPTASISPLKTMISSFSLSDCLHRSSQNDDFQFFSLRLSPSLLSKRWFPVFLYPTGSISPLKTMTSSFSLSDCLHFSSQTMTSSFSLSDCLHRSSKNDDFQFFSIRLPPFLLPNDDFQFFSIRLSPFLLWKRWLPVFLYPTASISPLKTMPSSFSLSDCLHFSSQNYDFQFFSIRLPPSLLSKLWLPVFLFPTVSISPLKPMISSFSLSDCLHFSSQTDDFQFFSIRLSSFLLSNRWLPVFLYPTVSISPPKRWFPVFLYPTVFISPLKPMTSSFSLSDCLHFSSQTMISSFSLSDCLHFSSQTDDFQFFSIRLPPFLLSKRWLPVFSLSDCLHRSSQNDDFQFFLYPTVSIAPLKTMTSSFSLSDCLHRSSQTDDFQFFLYPTVPSLLSKRWFPVFLYPTASISPLKPMISSFFSIRLSPSLLSKRWLPVFLYPTASIAPLKTMISSFFSIRLPPSLLSKRWFPVFLYPTASIAPLKTMISSFFSIRLPPSLLSKRWLPVFLYPTASIAPLKTMISSFFSIRLPPFLLSKRWLPVFLHPTASIAPLKPMTSSFSLSDCLHRSSQTDDFQFF